MCRLSRQEAFLHQDLEGTTIGPLDGSVCCDAACRTWWEDRQRSRPTRSSIARCFSLARHGQEWSKWGLGLQTPSQRGFVSPRNAPDRRISANTRDQSGHTKANGPRAWRKEASGMRPALRRFDYLYFLYVGPNYVLGCVKSHSFYVFRYWVLCSNGLWLICSGQYLVVLYFFFSDD
jgi:hypothetical protein